MTDVRRLPLGILALALAFSLGHAAASTPSPDRPHPAAFPPPFDDPDDVPLPDPDLWHRIRVGFALEPLDSPLVAQQEEWYTARPDYISRFVDRGSLYLHHIVEEVEKRGMPMEIALLPVIESAFNPHAYSRARASGLWQFIPSTGKTYGLSQDWWKDNRRDVIAATDAALTYLEKLHAMFNSWELALAAYNCGEGCVARAIALNQKKGLPTDYLSLRLPKETVGYVPKLMAVKNIVLAPAAYGIELESVPDQAYFVAVPAPERIDVKLAAQLAGMSVEEFVALNPSNNKAVAVARTGTLLVPIDKAENFANNLQSYDKPLVTWNTYAAKKGESLDVIAQRYGVAGYQLRAANGPVRLNKKGRLAASQMILVPARAPVVAAKAPPATPVAASEATGPSVTEHRVQSGDSLWTIASYHDMSVEDLKVINGLSSDRLRIGQVIRLTDGPVASNGTTKPVTSAPLPVTPAKAEAQSPRWYTVRSGDTIHGIARRFNAAVADLLHVNNLTVKAVIQPGLKLRIP
jgi:membrane-bound lytic murein transglycosylase D